MLKRSVDEKFLDLSEFNSDEVAIYNSFLETRDEDFSGREVMALLQFLPKINNFQHLYWKNKTALEKYLKYMEVRPIAFDVFIKMSTDFFERGILPIPSYENIPMLIIYSDDDGITPWETNGKKMLEQMPHAKTKLISDGYHWIHLEKTESCMEATLNFLS